MQPSTQNLIQELCVANRSLTPVMVIMPAQMMVEICTNSPGKKATHCSSLAGKDNSLGLHNVCLGKSP